MEDAPSPSLAELEERMLRRNEALDARAVGALLQADAALLRLDVVAPTILPSAAAVRLATPQAASDVPAAAAPSAPPPPSAALARSRPASAAAPPGLASSSDELLDGIAAQPEAAVRLAKARIRVLESELAAAREALDGANKSLAGKDKELKVAESEKVAAQKAERAAAAAADKHARAVAEAREALEAERAERTSLSKENDRTARVARANEAEVRGAEVRLARALEDVERYKRLLEEVKTAARGGGDGARREAERLGLENKKLERQKAELLAAFRKQLRLVAVLKKQRMHLEAARSLAFTEDEFLRALDSGA